MRTRVRVIYFILMLNQTIGMRAASTMILHRIYRQPGQRWIYIYICWSWTRKARKMFESNGIVRWAFESLTNELWAKLGWRNRLYRNAVESFYCRKRTTDGASCVVIIISSRPNHVCRRTNFVLFSFNRHRMRIKCAPKNGNNDEFLFCLSFHENHFVGQTPIPYLRSNGKV